MKNKRNSVRKQICSIVVSSMMIFMICNSVLAAPASNIKNIPNNSLVIGKYLFRLDKVTNNEYNLGSFVQASKTVDNNNGIYYKHNGKWYTDRDIENIQSFKNAVGLNTIPNDILKIDGKDVKDEMKLQYNGNDIKKDFNIIDEEHSCIMNIHYINYAVIVLKKGNFNDCSFYINGEKVFPQRVNEEGNIIKIELKDRKDKNFIVESQGKKEEITLKYKNF